MGEGVVDSDGEESEEEEDFEENLPFRKELEEVFGEEYGWEVLEMSDANGDKDGVAIMWRVRTTNDGR